MNKKIKPYKLRIGFSVHDRDQMIEITYLDYPNISKNQAIKMIGEAIIAITSQHSNSTIRKWKLDKSGWVAESFIKNTF